MEVPRERLSIDRHALAVVPLAATTPYYRLPDAHHCSPHSSSAVHTATPTTRRYHMAAATSPQSSHRNTVRCLHLWPDVGWFLISLFLCCCRCCRRTVVGSHAGPLHVDQRAAHRRAVQQDGGASWQAPFHLSCSTATRDATDRVLLQLPCSTCGTSNSTAQPMSPPRTSPRPKTSHARGTRLRCVLLRVSATRAAAGHQSGRHHSLNFPTILCVSSLYRSLSRQAAADWR